MLRRALPLILSAALVLATTACGGGDDEGSAATTTPPTSEAPSTTTPPDPFAVPAEIDEAYVERVVNELDRVAGNATRLAVQRGEVTREVREMMGAIYTDENVLGFISELEAWTAEDFAPLRRPPGDPVTTVDDLITANDRCIVVRATQDTSEMLADPLPPGESIAVLFQSDDATGHNPTPWMLDGLFRATYLDETADPCTGA